MDVPVFHGYELHTLSIFHDELDRLVTEVERLQAKAPDNFDSHPLFKLLEGVLNNITEFVPSNPADPAYRLGNTMGKTGKAWSRVKKKTLPDRYRLFFRFNSHAPKSIIYAWLNNEATLRKDGAKTDVYHVFEKMLDKGTVPNTWQELVEGAAPLDVG
jgi:toxin YhaV